MGSGHVNCIDEDYDEGNDGDEDEGDRDGTNYDSGRGGRSLWRRQLKLRR